MVELYWFVRGTVLCVGKDQLRGFGGFVDAGVLSGLSSVAGIDADMSDLDRQVGVLLERKEQLVRQRRQVSERTFELAAANPTFENCVKALTLPPSYSDDAYVACVEAIARFVAAQFPAPGRFVPSDPHPVLYASSETGSGSVVPVPNFYLPESTLPDFVGLSRWADVWLAVLRRFQSVVGFADVLTLEDPSSEGFYVGFVELNVSAGTASVYTWDIGREEVVYQVLPGSDLGVLYSYLLGQV